MKRLLSLALIIGCGTEATTAPSMPEATAVAKPVAPAKKPHATYVAGITMWRSDTGTYVQATQNDSTVVWVELQRLDGSVISDTYTIVANQSFNAGSRSADWSLTVNDIAVTWHNSKSWARQTAKVITQVGGSVTGSVNGKPLSANDQGYLMIQN